MSSTWTHRSGVFSVTSDATMSGAGELRVVGEGAVIEKAVASTTSINTRVDLSAGSSLNVRDGTLQLGGGGLWQSGTTATVVGLSTLRVTGGTVTVNGTIAGSSGVVEVTGGLLVVNGCPTATPGVAFSIAGGEMQINCPTFTPTIAISSGTVAVEQDRSYASPLVVTGTGALTVAAGATLTLLQGATVSSSAGIQLAALATVNFAGGTVELTSTGALSGDGHVVVAGANVTVTASLTGLTAAAFIRVSDGSLSLAGSSSLLGAHLSVSGSGVVSVNTATTLAGPVNVSGGGRLDVGAATALTVSSGLSVVDSAAVAIFGGDLTLASDSLCLIAGGTITIAGAHTLRLNTACTQSGGTVTGDGSLISSGGYHFQGGAWQGTGFNSMSGALWIEGLVAVARPVSLAVVLE